MMLSLVRGHACSSGGKPCRPRALPGVKHSTPPTGRDMGRQLRLSIHHVVMQVAQQRVVVCAAVGLGAMLELRPDKHPYDLD